MKKRLLSVFLCLCMVFGLVPATVWAETTNGHTHYLCGGSTCNGSGHKNETYKTTFEKEIKQEGNTLKIGGEPWVPTKGSNDTFYILPAGTYYLGSDISSGYTIKIENNVTLCLNGHKITAANGMDAIKLTGGSFTLTDCQKTGNITHASNTNGRGVYVSSGTFNMYGGSITGNTARDARGCGGGVYVASGSGTFNMYGGSITGNRATGDGGGVYKCGSNSSFNMYGGSITGNRATGDGGGVYKCGSNSSFNMYGGSITGNNANSYGGGVYVDGGEFTMSGGTIGGTKTGETNTATYGGGGVEVSGGMFTMKDSASITGNKADYGGGVNVTFNGEIKGTFEMKGGSITGNTANSTKEGGGGVYAKTNFEMTGGSIGGNTTKGYGGGVYVTGKGSFTMSGGSITGNNANSNGGGVYVMYSDSFTVSGEVTVTDNTKGGTKGADGKFTGDTKNNVYLPTGKTITIGTDKLSEGAQLGMTLDEYYGDKAFTSGWNANMSGKSPADYFISDVGDKGFELSGGEVKLCDGHAHYLCGGSTCNSSGHATESSKTTFAKEIKQVSGTLYIDNIEWTVSSYGNYTLPEGAYYLSTDLTPDYMIQTNGSVTLCLNGHSITANHDGDVIAANSGVTFTLTDCKDGNSNAAFGKITHASGKDGRGVYVFNRSTTFNMYGGSIADNNMVTDDYVGNDEIGGGVYIADDGATFNMYGGTICGNTAGSSGGGVYMGEKTNFNMYGGAICGNTATRNFGGGVCAYKSSKFYMSGGEIGDNGTRCGGGVFVGDNSTFTMTGGSITGNNVSHWRAGGGIYISDSAKKITVSGNIQITGNMKTGTKNENGKYTDGKVENLYLNDGITITVGGALADSSKLGVTLANDYGDNAFTSGWKTNMSGKTPTDHFTSDVDGYEAKLYDTELKLVSTHVHSWTYTANGDKITATCKNCEDNNGQNFVGGTCTITAADATYNGSVKTAVVSETGIFENVDMSISYSKYNATSKQFESINILPAGAGRYKASITYSGATAGVEYTIKKATQEAPEGLTVSPAGSIGGKGKINGTTSGTYNEVKAMEFNTSATATTGWKDCSDSSTEVAPGTYYVRYKETDNYYASAVSAALTVKEHTHFGGNATCQEKAICDGCGQEYGEFGNHKFTETVSRMYLKSASTCQSPAVYYKRCLVCDKKSSETFEYGAVDPSNHKHTEVRNAKSATCCEKGYTGDTYCTDCNALVSIGAEIPATGNHTDVDGKWESDETNHWHTCYFGTKFDVTVHNGGEATCKNQAKCSECGHSYGSLDASNHKGTTYLKNQSEATCYKKGYTGDTYCSDCNEKIADGQSIAKNAHNPASVWTTDEQNHWKKCQTVGCGNVIDKAAHNGGEATCVSKAVCEVCKVQYGDIDAANHKHTEIRGAVPATEQEKGYTGDTWCLDCNKKIADGKETDRLSHSLKKVEAKAATTRGNGNIEYYHCDGCDKYFADESGTKEISREETIIKKLPPKIIEGNNAIVNNGEKKSLTFRSDAAFTDFIRVELDGKVLDEKDYTKAEGSIIVTLNNNFVSTLSVGEHTLGIVSESGTATAKFTVKASEMPNESPKTGDNNMVAFWSLAAILSLAVLGFTTVASKKKRAK